MIMQQYLSGWVGGSKTPGIGQIPCWTAPPLLCFSAQGHLEIEIILLHYAKAMNKPAYE